MYDHRIGYVYKIQGQLGFLPNLKATLVASCLIYLSCVSFLPVLTNPPLFLNDDHDALSVVWKRFNVRAGALHRRRTNPSPFTTTYLENVFLFFFFSFFLKCLLWNYIPPATKSLLLLLYLPGKEKERRSRRHTHTQKCKLGVEREAVQGR